MLDPDTTSTVAVIAAGVAGLSLLLVLWLFLRLRRLGRALVGLTGAGAERTSFVGALERSQASNEGLRREVTQLRADLSAARADLSGALRHVAVVRYDAFDDHGGRLSFSAALLDDAGDGLIMTSINARSETRTYAKGVKGGSSDHSLSPEEEQAIGFATRKGAPVDTPVVAEPRRSPRRWSPASRARD
ncbi:MAG: hypothetical protein JWL64_2625 [Frankiales bacterium]|nr:hypothetical protein [Frankiales bacterium]